MSVPSNIEDAGTNVLSALIPPKSKLKYEKTYEKYLKSCNQKKMQNITSEKVLLAYFHILSKKYKSYSVWVFYSMLKATTSTEINVDINKCKQLIAFLKRQSEGDRPKNSKIFTKDEIGRFLKEAEDKKFLLTKVGYA